MKASLAKLGLFRKEVRSRRGTFVLPERSRNLYLFQKLTGELSEAFIRDVRGRGVVLNGIESFANLFELRNFLGRLHGTSYCW